MTSSEQRVLTALTMVKTLADQDKEILFEQISNMLQISKGLGSVLKKMGTIVQRGVKKYDWIGGEPNYAMVSEFKKCRNNMYYKSDGDDVESDYRPFQEETIDEKLNHLEFMINEIFSRVDYLFTSLATREAKEKINSEWFTGNKQK